MKNENSIRFYNKTVVMSLGAAESSSGSSSDDSRMAHGRLETVQQKKVC